MKKGRKLDIRITDEQYAWLEDQANKRTISKAACFRMLLEEMRRADYDSIAEDATPYAHSAKSLADGAPPPPSQPHSAKALAHRPLMPEAQRALRPKKSPPRQKRA